MKDRRFSQIPTDEHRRKEDDAPGRRVEAMLLAIIGLLVAVLACALQGWL